MNIAVFQARMIQTIDTILMQATRKKFITHVEKASKRQNLLVCKFSTYLSTTCGINNSFCRSKLGIFFTRIMHDLSTYSLIYIVGKIGS